MDTSNRSTASSEMNFSTERSSIRFWRQGSLLKPGGNTTIRSGHTLLLVEKAKGKKRRETPMTARGREILRAVSLVLFRDLTNVQVTHKFTDCAKRIGLKGLKLHSLRHTFGTYLIAMGYDITVVKELLGHEDIKTTLVYAKADSRLLRDAIKSFEVLGRNGYKMATAGEGGKEKPLDENRQLVSG